jgi:hypothetical protein
MYRRYSFRLKEERDTLFHVAEIQFQIQRRKGQTVHCSGDTVPDTAKKGTDCSL